MFKIIACVAVVTIVGLFALSKIDQGKANSSNDNTSSEVNQDDLVKVNIYGEINHPGDYFIEATKTLGDLINLAGGITSEADPKAYTESVVIGTRTKFYIPTGVEIPDECVVETIKKVNINNATMEELMNVGFKSNQATEIISYRKEKGNFNCLEDLLEVKGIGDATFAKLKDLLTLR